MENLQNNTNAKILSNSEMISFFNENAQEFSRLMAYYKCAMMEIETKFNVLNEEYSLEYDRNPISSIKTRLKSPASIYEKLKRREIELSTQGIENELFDIAGVRVICSFPDDVYSLANALLQQDDVRLIIMKDYIKNPKPNGYRSLHMIVEIPIFLAHQKRMMKVEIQLRTIAMDFWASLEHQICYKKDNNFSEKQARELYDCAQVIAELDVRMDKLRQDVLLKKAEKDGEK